MLRETQLNGLQTADAVLSELALAKIQTETLNKGKVDNLGTRFRDQVQEVKVSASASEQVQIDLLAKEAEDLLGNVIVILSNDQSNYGAIRQQLEEFQRLYEEILKFKKKDALGIQISATEIRGFGKEISLVFLKDLMRKALEVAQTKGKDIPRITRLAEVITELLSNLQDLLKAPKSEVGDQIKVVFSELFGRFQELTGYVLRSRILGVLKSAFMPSFSRNEFKGLSIEQIIDEVKKKKEQFETDFPLERESDGRKLSSLAIAYRNAVLGGYDHWIFNLESTRSNNNSSVLAREIQVNEDHLRGLGPKAFYGSGETETSFNPPPLAKLSRASQASIEADDQTGS